jgi:hypothetical protein
MDRLVALTLSALLAGPGVILDASSPIDESGASSGQGPGMDAPPRPSASAALSLAPAAMAASCSAIARVIVTPCPVASGHPADDVGRPTGVVKSAPTILRI